MRIIAIANQKGGVGKTTTTVNLAAALAKLNQRVILMDLDPQAHLTTFFGLDLQSIQNSCYELLTQSISLDKCLIPNPGEIVSIKLKNFIQPSKVLQNSSIIRPNQPTDTGLRVT